MRSKFFHLMLALIAAASLFLFTACGDDSESSDNGSVKPPVGDDDDDNPYVPAYGSTVSQLVAGDYTVLVYYPEPNEADELGVKTTCTAPAIIVFGDGALSDSEAVEYANESGLAEIAAENGSSVVFVKPSNGETWTAEDEGAYAAVAQKVSDSSTAAVEDGIAVSINFMTQAEERGISGTQQRLYVYAAGAGADFAASHYVKPITGQTPWGMTTTLTPTGLTLEGISNDGVAESFEANDMPVVSIGNSSAVNTALQASCGSVLIKDEADYAAEFETVIGNNRRQNGVLLPVHDYAALGIVEEIGAATVNTTDDNGSETYAGTETHPVNYIVYYADDLDIEAGNVPLVFCFHGGGNTALYEAQASEWPLIAKEHGFIAVSVDHHHPDCSAGEIVQLIEHLKTEYSINEKKIYASGFSMGGAKSWDIYEQFPEVFAAVSPQDASFAPGTDSWSNTVENPNSDTLLPVFFVAGETSPLAEMPKQSADVFDRVKTVFTVNGVVNPYSYTFEDQTVWDNEIWAAPGDIVYQVTDHAAFTDSTLTVLLFESSDGNYYTALASASNQSHEVYARNSWAAWDFLCQFSREADGSISIESVTYTLPADDSSISDNGYNLP